MYERIFDGEQCLVVAVERVQDVCAADPDVNVDRVACEGFVIGSHCLVVAIQRGKSVTLAIWRLSGFAEGEQEAGFTKRGCAEVWIGAQGLVVGSQRLLRATQPGEDVATVAECGRMVRTQGERAVEGGQRLAVVDLLVQHIAQVKEGGGVAEGRERA